MNSKHEPWFGKPELDAIKNGCDVIIDDDIKSIRKPDIYDDWLNEQLFEALKKSLEHSMKRKEFKYGETGYVIRSDFKLISIPVDGNYDGVKLVQGALVQALNSKYGIQYGCLICVHNHPNNTSFSFNDIKNFLSFDTISAIAVVGNTHNVYILRKRIEKDDHFDYRAVKEKMNNYLIKKLLEGSSHSKAIHAIAKYVENNADKCNLEFIHKKRQVSV